MSTQIEDSPYDLEEYREWLETERRYTDGTVDNYMTGARSLCRFLGDREVTIELYREWIRHLIAEGKAASTVNTYHSWGTRFVEWCDASFQPTSASGELPDYDPDELPEPLTRQQVRDLYDGARNPEERYIVALLYHTGLRSIEFRNLQWQDIDWSRRELNIRRRKKKGWGRDTLPLFEFQMDVLEELREWRDDDNPYLLPASTGGAARGDPELLYEEEGERSDKGLQNRVKSIAKRARIERRVWPHLFRHTRATHMLEEGKDITEVNEWMGHDKIETTMRYARLTGEVLRDVEAADSGTVFQEESDDEE